MLDFFYKFSWESIKFDYQVLACLILVWTAVVVCAVFSIMSRPFDLWQRVFWITLVICLPALGLLFYLPFSLKAESSPEFFFARKVRNK
jgi:hypothetical protein